MRRKRRPSKSRSPRHIRRLRNATRLRRGRERSLRSPSRRRARARSLRSPPRQRRRTTYRRAEGVVELVSFGFSVLGRWSRFRGMVHGDGIHWRGQPLLGPGDSGVDARKPCNCVGFCTISCITTPAGDGVKGEDGWHPGWDERCFW